MTALFQPAAETIAYRTGAPNWDSQSFLLFAKTDLFVSEELFGPLRPHRATLGLRIELASAQPLYISDLFVGAELSTRNLSFAPSCCWCPLLGKQTCSRLPTLTSLSASALRIERRMRAVTDHLFKSHSAATRVTFGPGLHLGIPKTIAPRLCPGTRIAAFLNLR